MKLLKKSKMCLSKQYALLQKGCQKGDLIEFHVDDSSALAGIVKDWPLKGKFISEGVQLLKYACSLDKAKALVFLTP